MAKNESDFSIKTRRTSRVAIRFPVQITVRNGSATVEEVTAWTMVVNEHGARCECARSFAVDQEVEIVNPANRKTSTGRIVWCGATPDGAGKFEFAVELREAANFWHISFPPRDWKFTDVAAAAIPAAAAAPAAPAAVPAPVMVSAPVVAPAPATARIGSAVAEKVPQPVASMQAAPPKAVPDPVPTNPVKPNGSAEKTTGMAAFQDRVREEERLAMAALAAEVSTILEPDPTQPAHPVAAQASSASLPNPSSDVPGLQERLTQRLMEQIEPLLQPRMEEVLERTVRGLENRLSAVLLEVCESRAAEMLERSKEITNLGLSCIAEAADDRSKHMRRESEEAVSAAMQELRGRIAKFLTSVEDDLLRQRKPGGTSRTSV